MHICSPALVSCKSRMVQGWLSLCDPAASQPKLPPCKASLQNHMRWLHIIPFCLWYLTEKKKKKEILRKDSFKLNFPVYAWMWISSSVFSESRDGFAISWSKSSSVFAAIHWLLLISPMNLCTSQRKEEFCEGFSEITNTLETKLLSMSTGELP